MNERGTGVYEIDRLLGINKATVSRAIQRFEETGSNIDRPGRGSKRSARTRENIRKIKAKIQRNPSSRKNSTRKIASAYGISPKPVHWIFANELKLKFWKPLKRHNLTKKKPSVY
uniref:Homeodomain-like DNA binding domain-containing transcription factor n=1 Tax=Acrobeloides nanus TaxID=290746 RepID=A0A914DCN6_9BILA